MKNHIIRALAFTAVGAGAFYGAFGLASIWLSTAVSILMGNVGAAVSALIVSVLFGSRERTLPAESANVSSPSAPKESIVPITLYSDEGRRLREGRKIIATIEDRLSSRAYINYPDDQIPNVVAVARRLRDAIAIIDEILEPATAYPLNFIQPDTIVGVDEWDGTGDIVERRDEVTSDDAAQ